MPQDSLPAWRHWSKLGLPGPSVPDPGPVQGGRANGEEQVEARDVLMASVLVDYFKAHSRRVLVGLHGRDAEDLLAVELLDSCKSAAENGRTNRACCTKS